MLPWILATIALVFLLGTLLLHGGSKPAKPRQYDCMGKDNETILVLMHSYKSNKETVFTMCQMIQAASCPHRLFFGIQQDVKREQDVYDMYVATANTPQLKDHIRVLTRPSHQTHGPLASLTEMYNRLHDKERYVLLTAPGTIFADGFDDLLVRELPEGGVLTGAGTRKVQKETKWMGYLNATLPRYLPRRQVDQTSSFPVIMQSRPGNMPVVRSRSTARANHPYGAVALDPRLVFFKHGILEIDVFLYPPSAGLCLSAIFYHAGIAFYAPPRTVAWGLHTLKDAKGPLYNEKEMVEWLKSQQAFVAFSGLDHRLRPTGRAQLGLLRNFPYKFIKFADETAFQREKAQFTT
jgi:hypothetical protein